MNILPLMKKRYRPMGTRLLVQLEERSSRGGVLIPEGARTAEPTTAQVLDIGPAVNEEKFQVKVGDIIVLNLAPSFLFPINQKERLILIERHDIVAVMTEEEDK